MFIVYLLLGGLFSWLAIKSFCVAFSGNDEDEHAFLVDDEDSEFDDNVEEEWEYDSELENDDDCRGESEDEYLSDWCPEDLIEEVE